MPRRVEGTLAWLRGRNRERVIAELRTRGALSQAELARTTGLSRTTVSSLVAELKEAGLLRELDANQPGRRGGRPALQLELHDASRVVVGVDCGHSHVRVAVADPAAHVLAERRVEIDVDHDASTAMDEAARLVAEVLAIAGVERQQVIGIGMGIPGPVDRVRGSVGSSTILPAWVGLPIAAEMEERIGLPVEIDNDANLGALAELNWGAGRGCNNFAYIKMATGVGAGLVLDGRPLRGASGTAGEIGHLTLDEAGLLCYCGNRGCLETVSSGQSILRLVNQDRDLELSLTEVVDGSLNGDIRCRRAIADAGRELGVAVAGLCNLMNPQRVVVGGLLSRAGEILLAPLRESLQRHAVLAAAQSAEVVASAFPDRGELLGALALALHESGVPAS